MNRHIYYFGGAVAALFISCIIHVNTGATYLSTADWLRIIGGHGTADELTMLFDFRMVRTVLAVLIGAGLALAGTVFQTVAHNELAGPGILGVNAGAGLAVTLCIFYGPVETGMSFWELPAAAIGGAALTAVLIYRLAYRRGRQSSSYALVLNGISVGAGIHALQLILIVRLGPEQFQKANTWLLGSIFGASWMQAALTALVLIGVGLLLQRKAMVLNLLRLSADSAVGLGVAVKREQAKVLLLAVSAAAVCVAVGGSIGFVGLVAPHIARRLMGADHRRILPMAALSGAVMVVAADWLGRVIVAPDELLTGVVTALIGAPYFLYLLARRKG